jgi:phage pi2 protein 07
VDLLNLANNYEEDLRKKCLDVFRNGISVENVCSLYYSSIKYNLIEFENRWFEFAKNKMNQIFKSGTISRNK